MRAVTEQINLLNPSLFYYLLGGFTLLSQNVWTFFLFYVAFSKYGNIKLGKDHEKPEHSNIAYFAMLFACGIAVGVYYWGVSEPIYYYRGGKLYKPGFYNDDQRAQNNDSSLIPLNQQFQGRSKIWTRQPVYKNRLRDRFSGSKSRQVTGQRFSGANFRQKSRTGF